MYMTDPVTMLHWLEMCVYWHQFALIAVVGVMWVTGPVTILYWLEMCVFIAVVDAMWMTGAAQVGGVILPWHIIHIQDNE